MNIGQILTCKDQNRPKLTGTAQRQSGQRPIDVQAEHPLQFINLRSAVLAQHEIQRVMNESPGAKALATTLQSLNQRPHVAAQTKAGARQLAHPEASGVVQRKIYMPAGGDWDNPEIAELKESPLYKELDANKSVIVIKEGPQETAVTVVKTHNKTDVDELLQGTRWNASEVNFIVNVQSRVLKAVGAVIEDSRFYRWLGKGLYSDILLNPPVARDPLRHESGNLFFSSLLTSRQAQREAELNLYSLPELRELEVMLGPKRKGWLSDPAWQSTEPANTSIASAASAMAFLQSKEGKLSLYTTLLHELGHVMQNLKTPRIFGKAPLKEVKSKHIPPMPDQLVKRVTYAFNKSIVADPVWFELLDFKSVMDKWLSPVKDFFQDEKQDNELAELAQAEIDLGDDLAPYVHIWIEYDVITNVEHPAALKRGEIIRHTHGVEGTVGAAATVRTTRKRRLELDPENKEEIEMGWVPGASIIAELGITNDLSAPPSIKGVQSLMIANAKRLTEPLLEMLPTYVEYYEKLVGAVQK